jgi:hypothetical protein
LFNTNFDALTFTSRISLNLENFWSTLGYDERHCIDLQSVQLLTASYSTEKYFTSFNEKSNRKYGPSQLTTSNYIIESIARAIAIV